MTSQIYTISILTFFSVWLLISIFCQFNKTKIGTFFRQLDLFSLIPYWSFFAPNPGTTDYHLLYRDKVDTNTGSYWKEYKLSSNRSLLGAVWNPKKRTKKVLSDAVSSLLTLSKDIKNNEYKTTLPYIALLNFIASIPRENTVTATQFVIMESYGHFTTRTPKVIFRSEFHKI